MKHFSQKETKDEAPPMEKKQTLGFASKKLHYNSEARKELEKCETLDFNIFKLRRETEKNELFVLSNYLMNKHDFFNILNIDPEVFGHFTKKIQSGYNDVPYHNQIHASDVC